MRAMTGSPSASFNTGRQRQGTEHSTYTEGIFIVRSSDAARSISLTEEQARAQRNTGLFQQPADHEPPFY